MTAPAQFVPNPKLVGVAKTVGNLIGYSALPAMAGLAQYLFSRKSLKGEIDGLRKSYDEVLRINEKLRENKPLATKRFQELCAVAPVVAMNPDMTAKFLEPRLESGLSIDDVHKLTSIQTNLKPSIFSKTPSGEAARTAGIVLDRVFTTFGMRLVDDVRANFKGDASMMNKQSSQKISEECVAEMLADRYVMWRQSPLSKEGSAQRLLARGAKDFGTGLALFAAPLAIAGLVHGAGAILDAHKKKEMDRDANLAFDKIKKDSELIKGNLALAHEALDAMKSFAPALAAKPSILKTFIEHTISVEGRIPVETIKGLAETQGHVFKSKHPGFAQGFFGTLTPALGAGKTISDKGDEGPL